MGSMRNAVFAAAAFSFGLAACSGSSVPAGNQTTRFLELAGPPLTAPLAAGQSTTLSYREVVCHSSTDSRGNGEFNKRCDPPFTPQTILAGTINETLPWNSQCTVSAPRGASVTVTKTVVGTVNASCTINVSDPYTGASTSTQ